MIASQCPMECKCQQVYVKSMAGTRSIHPMAYSPKHDDHRYATMTTSYQCTHLSCIDHNEQPGRYQFFSTIFPGIQLEQQSCASSRSTGTTAVKHLSHFRADKLSTVTVKSFSLCTETALHSVHCAIKYKELHSSKRKLHPPLIS